MKINRPNGQKLNNFDQSAAICRTLANFINVFLTFLPATLADNPGKFSRQD